MKSWEPLGKNQPFTFSPPGEKARLGDQHRSSLASNIPLNWGRSPQPKIQAFRDATYCQSSAGSDSRWPPFPFTISRVWCIAMVRGWSVIGWAPRGQRTRQDSTATLLAEFSKVRTPCIAQTTGSAGLLGSWDFVLYLQSIGQHQIQTPRQSPRIHSPTLSHFFILHLCCFRAVSITFPIVTLYGRQLA